MEEFGCCPDNILAARGPDNEGSTHNILTNINDSILTYFLLKIKVVVVNGHHMDAVQIM